MRYVRSLRMLIPAVAMLAAVAMLLPACSGSSESSSESQENEGMASTGDDMSGSQPMIQITEPADGATLPPGKVVVNVQVSNFQLVDKLGQPAEPGQGHIHYFLDVTPPTTPGKPATVQNGMFAPSAKTTYTFDDVKNGPHMVAVELVNNDHTPLQPAVVDSVHFTVEEQMMGASDGTGY